MVDSMKKKVIMTLIDKHDKVVKSKWLLPCCLEKRLLRYWLLFVFPLNETSSVYVGLFPFTHLSRS